MTGVYLGCCCRFRRRVQIHDVLVHNNQKAGNEDVQVLTPSSFLKANEYKQNIAECKMAVTTIGMPGRFDLLGTRYYEIMASGTTLLIAQRAESNYSIASCQQLGIVDNETVVEFSNVSELIRKIRYYKEHPEEAQRLIQAAQQVAAQQHTWDVRGKVMVAAIDIRDHSKCNKAA